MCEGETGVAVILLKISDHGWPPWRFVQRFSTWRLDELPFQQFSTVGEAGQALCFPPSASPRSYPTGDSKTCPGRLTYESAGCAVR
jgi:hypothetical protein